MNLKELAEKFDVKLEFMEDQLKKGIEVEKEHLSDLDDIDGAEKIAMDHLHEMPDYYDRLEKMEKKGEKQNASQLPKVYYCRHIEKGVTGYEDETILVDDDCLNKMDKTFEGVPVRVQHVDNVDLDKLQEESDGYVAESFYCKEDGWHWAKFIAVSDACHNAIKQGWKVSNAYIPTRFGEGGDCHNIPFNRKILDGKYTHLAIVPNPRYEGALIMTPDQFKAYKEEKTQELQNSKKGRNIMFKFFKKEAVEQEIDEKMIVQFKNGKEMTMEEVQNALESIEQLKNECEELKKENKKLKKNMESEDDVDDDDQKNEDEKDEDKENKKKAKKNEDEDEDKKNEDEDEDDKKNEDEDEEGKKNKKQKKNANFKQLKNAGAHNMEEQVVETSMDKVERGKERY